jgi:hypothetical protein
MSQNKKALTVEIGDKVGNFVVLVSELVGKNKTWICRCSCGSEKRFWKISSISKQKTCGCGTDSTGLTAKQRRSMLTRMQGYKSGAKKRLLEWELSYEDFVEVSTGNCFYCNSDPKIWDCVSNAPSIQKDSPNIRKEDYKIKFNGIDRLNSDIGYVLENVVTCCTNCNRAKSDMSLSEFRSHTEKIYLWLFHKE